MRVVRPSKVLLLLSFVTLGLALSGCPEKGGAPADQTAAEPERAEPDDGADDKAKKPAAAAPAAADEKKPDENKDEGGW